MSGLNVTPSKIIDVVWHEHLLFSKAYREVCGIVIEDTFDHGSFLLPIDDQTNQISHQYLEIRELYLTEFGIDAPVDIWGNIKFDK